MLELVDCWTHQLIRLDLIALHTVQPHQADQMFDPHRCMPPTLSTCFPPTRILQTCVENFGSTNHVVLPHDALLICKTLKEMGPLVACTDT